jgi:thiamine biosynthesis lipoprotein
MQYHKKAHLMWTDIEITIVSDKNPQKYLYNCFWIIYSLELEFSRFLSDSILSKLNNEKFFEVSDTFIDVLNKSKELHMITNWYFNPLVNISRIWYSSTFENNDFEKKLLWDNTNLDDVKILWNLVTLANNQNVDFWWIVKGYSVDLVADYLQKNWFNDFIINAWWDIYLSWNNHWQKWVVWIDNPTNNKEVFATLELENMSVSTSWSYKRNWKIWDESFHHILDPINGKNNNQIISITIISERTYLSDSYATACFNMWIEKSLEFLEKNKIDWVIVWSDWQVYHSVWVGKFGFWLV